MNNKLIIGTLFFNIICLIMLFVLDLMTKSNIILAMLLIVDSVIAAYVYRENKLLFLMCIYIAYANISIALGVYIQNESLPNFYSQIIHDSVYTQAIVSMILFMCIFLLPAFNKKTNLYTSDNLYLLTKSHQSVLIEIICIIAYAYIFESQITFEIGSRATTSAIGEYKFIFAIIGSIYAPKSNFHKYLWSFILLVSSLYCVIGGNRVDVFPLILILLLVFYPDIINKKLFIIYVFISIIILKISGMVRGDLWNMNLTMLKSAFNSLLIQDTFVFAYFPSLESIDLGISQDSVVKTELLFNNLKYIIFGGEYKEYVLPNYTQAYSLNYGGFIGPLYFNYWIGTIGAVFSGVIVAALVKFLSHNVNFIKNSLLICFVCTLPRWYTYNFLLIFRVMIIFIIVLLIFMFFEKLTNRKTI